MRVAIVLAAGRSRRFGAADKRRMRIGGRPLLDHAIRTARATRRGRVLLVLDPASRLRPAGVTIVRAWHAWRGLSASLAAAIAACRPRETELLIFLGDMPAIPQAAPHRLARALRQGAEAARAGWRGRPGHPVLLRRRAMGAPLPASGDRTAGLLPRRVVTIAMGRGVVSDVDRPGDRAAAARLIGRRG